VRDLLCMRCMLDVPPFIIAGKAALCLRGLQHWLCSKQHCIAWRVAQLLKNVSHQQFSPSCSHSRSRTSPGHASLTTTMLAHIIPIPLPSAVLQVLSTCCAT
jgi:hypothetical protein